MAFENICAGIYQQATEQGRLEYAASGFSSIFGMDWQLLVFVGLFITVACLGVLYMAGTFMRNAKLVAWTQSELFQVAVTAVLATFIIAWVAGTCNFPANIISGAASDANKNVYVVADDYLDWGIVQGYKAFGLITAANFGFGLVSGFYFAFDPLGVGSRLSPMGAFSQMSNIMFVMMSTFMVSFLVFSTQKLIIDYLVLAMLYFFLPLGLLMRSLSPTREFGGAMVGLALGLLIFYPLLIVFNKVLIQNQMEESFRQMENSISWSGLGSMVEGAWNAMTGMFTGGFSGFISGMLDVILVPISLIFVAARAGVYFFLIAVVLPIFDFILLIAIVRQLSKALGDEVDVTNLTRMI